MFKNEFQDIFVRPTNIPGLPPHRSYDMSIDLDSSKPLPKPARSYNLKPAHRDALDKYIDNALSRGFILPIEEAKKKYNFPDDAQVMAGVFIVEQANGKMRPCVNYAPLNAATQRDYYPMPLVEDLLNKVSGAVIYTQLDMPDAYHLIRIKDDDVWKTAFVCHRGVFVYQVMPFGLCNCPPVFQRFMLSILKDCLGYCHVYLDNMMIATHSPTNQLTEEIRALHFSKVSEVLRALKAQNLWLRPEKCTFGAEQIDFLGFIVDKDGLHMNPNKVKAITNWEAPSSKKGVQRFLGFCNFYRRFIPKYADITYPLNQLTKKNAKYDGKPITAKALDSFHRLQREFHLGRSLLNFDPHKQTRIKTDASDFAIAGLLQQLHGSTWRTVAFHSRTMLTAELNYEVFDKELLAIVDCFKAWRQLLILCQEEILVLADHKNLLYFAKKLKLNQRQYRWAIVLADFNFRIEYLPGPDNVEADALSRSTPAATRWVENPNLQTLFSKNDDRSLKFSATELRDISPGDLDDFPLIVDLPPLPVADHQTSLSIMRVQIQSRPSENEIGEIFAKFHDHKLAGHGGFEKTLELVTRNGYNWHGLRIDLRRYLKNCSECARNKTKRHLKYGLLHPLPVPIKPWDEISMDFITELPISNGCDQIWVIKDRLTKRGHFISCKGTMTVFDFVYLFIEFVFKLHGLPSFITSDRDKLFVSNLWKSLSEELNIQLRMSTKGHPETDGASEILNQHIEQYLRMFCTYEQTNWAKLLPLAEFCYNNSLNSSIQTTPFVADLGYHPRSWVTPNASMSNKNSKDIFEIQRNIDDRIELLRELNKSAQESYSIQANKSRIPGPDFKVGDLVMLNRKNIKTQRSKLKFDAKFVGPFKITKKINDVAFRLELPQSWRIHNVFHKWLLEPIGNNPFPNQITNPPPPELIEDDFEFEVDEIVDYRLFRGKKPQFLVHWKGYSYDRNTWEPEEHLSNATDLLDQFKAKHPELFKTDSSKRKSPLRGDNVKDLVVSESPKTRKRKKVGFK